MKFKIVIAAFALACSSWGATLSWSQSQDGTFLDVNIGSLAGSQVGAFGLNIEYNPNQLTILSAMSLGLLGIPDVETFWQSQSISISPSLQRLEVAEVSLLTGAELAILQPQTFGLIRLYVQWLSPGPVSLSLSGIISDAVGNPISTTFPGGGLSNIPEPGTSWLMGGSLALVGLLLRRQG